MMTLAHMLVPAEVFQNLTQQVQTLMGIIQIVAPFVPQLVQSAMPPALRQSTILPTLVEIPQPDVALIAQEHPRLIEPPA